MRLVMAKLVDIHIHLTDDAYRDLLNYLKTYLKATDAVLVCVSVDLKSSMECVEWAEEFRGKVLPFLGVHPQMAGEANIDRFLEYLMKMRDVAVGVGETGLDRRLGSKQDVGEGQRKVFRAQLEAAEKLGKPVSLHSRGTLKEIFETLPSYRVKNILLHWFAGSEDDAKAVADRGYYASFGPALVYSKGKRRLAALIPQEYILVETDGPVNFGGCFGGRAALPTFLPSVLFTLASVLGVSYDDAAALVHRNSERYLEVRLDG